MGPWSHGDWARESGSQRVGNIYFGDSISTWYQENVESRFFKHFLKDAGDGSTGLPEAYMYDTGKKEWTAFDSWPPATAQTRTMYTHADGSLSMNPSATLSGYSEFLSDLSKPVPYSEDIKFNFTPRKYMSDDQRFAARRPDVLVFETDVLSEDITLAGEIFTELYVSTTGTDADWVVKLVDVYPHDTPNEDWVTPNQKLSNYHQMVRSEVIRGRYRDSFSDPKPFMPNAITRVPLQLQDVYHTFKKGHKIQIQIQSTWFPLIDRNPQRYIPNIFKANEEDFINAFHRVYHGGDQGTNIKVQVLNK
jgi:putative CocE/NonD family hydrolase